MYECCCLPNWTDETGTCVLQFLMKFKCLLTCVMWNTDALSNSMFVISHCSNADFILHTSSQVRNGYRCFRHIGSVTALETCPLHCIERDVSSWLGPVHSDRGCGDVYDAEINDCLRFCKWRINAQWWKGEKYQSMLGNNKHTLE